MIRERGTPIASQTAMASSSGPRPSASSPAWTVIQMSSPLKPKPLSERSQAYSAAPCLKYWPIEKLPSISKKVRCRVVEPTFSMSTVRKLFWQVVMSGWGGFSMPRK